MKTLLNLRPVVGLLLCVCAVGFFSCSREIKNRNLAMIKESMSKKQVESILGQPSETKTHMLELETQKKTLEAARYYYRQNGETLEFVFVEDKLISQVGRLSKKD